VVRDDVAVAEMLCFVRRREVGACRAAVWMRGKAAASRQTLAPHFRVAAMVPGRWIVKASDREFVSIFDREECHFK
jgi:hypothetical protein